MGASFPLMNPHPETGMFGILATPKKNAKYLSGVMQTHSLILKARAYVVHAFVPPCVCFLDDRSQLRTWFDPIRFCGGFFRERGKHWDARRDMLKMPSVCHEIVSHQLVSNTAGLHVYPCLRNVLDSFLQK